MGEHHVGVLLSGLGHGVDIAEGDAEDDVGALTHQGVDGGQHLLLVLGDLVHDDQLGGGVHAQFLHGGGDAVVVSEGVTGGVVLAVDIDGAYLKIGAVGGAGGTGAPGGTGAGGAGGSAGLVSAAAGGQGQHHGHGHDHCKDLLHNLLVLLSFVGFDLFIPWISYLLY